MHDHVAVVSILFSRCLLWHISYLLVQLFYIFRLVIYWYQKDGLNLKLLQGTYSSSVAFGLL